jgi:ribose transport system substrate-binding protein
MTHNRRRRMLLAGTLAATGLAGVPSAQARPGGRLKIALVLKSLRDPFTVALQSAARNYQQHFASQFDLTVVGTESDKQTDAQIRMVEDAIRAKVNAVVIAPTDSKALTLVVARAVKAGIIVIAIDNPLDDAVQAAAGAPVPFVGPNNRHGAFQAGRYLATKLREGDMVGIVEGNPADRNAQQRTAGCKDAMNSAGLKIVAIEAADWDYAQGRDVATRMLNDYPRIRGLLCGNDNMAMGAVDAVRDAGRTGHVYITGYNDIEAIRPLIADGRVLATINQFAERQAVFGLDVAVKAVSEQRRQSELSPRIETPLQLVTAEKRS